MHKNQKPTIIFISPRPYWDGMRNNLIHFGTAKIRYYMDSHYSLQDIACALNKLEKRTWTTPTPPYIRSNFGLHGPGTIIAMMRCNTCLGAVYFVGPSVFARSIHIWSLFVDPRFRRMGLATQLLKIVVRAIRGLADSITYQTRLASDSMPLYLQMGPNLVVNCHVDDTNGDWANPKVVLKIKPPSKWRMPLKTSDFKSSKKISAVTIDDPFWKQINRNASMQGKYEIIGYTIENSKAKVLLRTV